MKNPKRGSKAQGSTRLWPWILGALVLVGIGFAWFLLPVGEWLECFSRWVQDMGAAGVAVFGVAYALGTILLVPGAALTVAAGIAYGWWAVPLVFVAAFGGASVAFLLGRYLLQARVCKAIEGRKTLRATVEAVDDEGWKVLLLLRVSPLVPFGAQNYLIGITKVPFAVFLLTTALGILPGTLVYTYVGVIGATAAQGGSARWALLIAGLVATVGVSIFIGVRAKQKLREKGVAKQS